MTDVMPSAIRSPSREAAATIPMLSARRNAGGIVRVRAPISDDTPVLVVPHDDAAPSHARRWTFPAGTRTPSSRTDSGLIRIGENRRIDVDATW